MYLRPGYPKIRHRRAEEVQEQVLHDNSKCICIFTLYANIDEVDPRDFFVEYKNRPELDRWILSKYNSLIEEVTDEMEVYDLTRAVRKIQDFLNEICQLGISEGQGSVLGVGTDGR